MTTVASTKNKNKSKNKINSIIADMLYGPRSISINSQRVDFAVSFASEDSSFMAHEKNIYEGVLYRSEKERREYDFHIEAISRPSTHGNP
jgi:vacuolar-type H+-ATPase subunit E/Vma4